MFIIIASGQKVESVPLDVSGIVVTGVTSKGCYAMLCCAVLAAQAMIDNEIMMCLEKRSGIWVQDPIRQ
jgi:hypothetical protein